MEEAAMEELGVAVEEAPQPNSPAQNHAGLCWLLEIPRCPL